MLEKNLFPEDIKKLNLQEKYALADEIRSQLLETVSQTGGHLASNLGSVELTIALHSVFSAPEDKIFFDVGHQAYTHKMLTGRTRSMKTIRKKGGLSGFPRIQESAYDPANAGHASDAISLALGAARAMQLQGKSSRAVAVVGDGALTGGMCYEALNDAGHTKAPLVIILNDNAMSISGNVGAISKHLTKMRGSAIYRHFKQRICIFLARLPHLGPKLTRLLTRLRDALKSLLVSDRFFDALDIEYLGPIDGHDIGVMERVFERAKRFDEPVVIHVITKKGKGYAQAEDEPEKFHGVQPFDQQSGEALSKSGKSAGSVAAQKLIALAEKNQKIVCVSAAMLAGTGMNAFQKAYPERCFDVGIAEEHAVAMAAGLALGGMRPYVCMYSTFLQRAYDQVLIDACLNGAPVTILIDRAGLNGADGETHQGIFDIAALRAIPNLVLAAPADTADLARMLEISERVDGPMAIRYPKALAFSDEAKDFALGDWEIIKSGADLTMIAGGRMVQIALRASEKLAEAGVSAMVINARFLCPMDENALNRALENKAPLITLEDGVVEGGFGEEILRRAREKGFAERVEIIGVPNRFIAHASVQEQTMDAQMDAESVCARALRLVRKDGFRADTRR